MLSRLIHEAVEKGFIDGIKISSTGPTLSHLLFTDDTLLFLCASTGNCQNLMQFLNTYCRASGQEVSMQKPSIFFGAKNPVGLRAKVCNILGMQQVDDPGNYLGIPTVWGKSKRNALTYVKDQITAKIQGWKNGLLSQASGEVLIKAVAPAMLAYPMNIFCFPDNICNDINATIANFWWGQKRGREKFIGLVGKAMGFQTLKDFNLHLLAKQCWRLIHELESLWAKVIKGRYFPNCSFLDAPKGGRAS